MDILLFANFSKRRRSTKRPALSEGVRVSVTLKSNTSKYEPTFTISGDLSANYTFAYVEAWGLWYNIIDTVSVANNFFELIMKCDPLATLADFISRTSAFVEYSTSNYDSMLNDVRVAQRETRSRHTNVVTSKFVDDPTIGCFVVELASDDLGLNYWAFSYSQFVILVMRLMDAGNLIDDLQKTFGDVIGGIISARYIPFTIGTLGGVQVDNVKIGTYETHASGMNVSRLSPLVYDSNYINIPWTYSDFRRNSNFTRVLLQLPFIGEVDISSETLLNRSRIRVDMVASCGLGIVTYGVYVEDDDGDDILIATYSGTFGICVPMGTGQVDAQGWLNGMISTAETLGLTMLTQNPAGLIGAGISFAGSCMSANKKDFTIVGDMGGTHGEEILKDYQLSVVSVDSRTNPEELRAIYGRPCGKVLTLGSLSGFVKTSGVSIDAPFSETIREEAEQLLDSGIYLE